MISYHHIVVVVSLGFMLYLTDVLKLNLRTHKCLIIGILSARENFKQRQAVRSTWGSLLKDEAVDMKFIVGSRYCPVPLGDRATPYKCEKWNPQLSLDGPTILKQTNQIHDTLQFVGYTFLVKQNLTIFELCICSDVLTPDNHVARVMIYNSFTGNVVASATFGYDPTIHSGSVIKKRIRPVQLYSSFEGEVNIVSKSYNCSSPYALLFPGAIHVFEGVDQKGKYVEFSTVRSRHTVLGWFNFRVLDIEYWRQHDNQRLSRSVKWETHNAILDDELSIECNEQGDIFLVEVLDVYSSLSSKLWLFLKWVASQNYDFVLKTDDDVFLDPKLIMEVLMQSEGAQEERWDWWSCFRVGWPAPNSGKWRDRTSTPRIYPTFPSGAGYVVRTSSLDKLLARSALLPEPSIGEDVFIGVLASGLNFTSLTNSSCYWACDTSCAEHPCNVPELSPVLMKKLWSSYLNCSKICECNGVYKTIAGR